MTDCLRCGQNNAKRKDLNRISTEEFIARIHICKACEMLFNEECRQCGSSNVVQWRKRSGVRCNNCGIHLIGNQVVKNE